MFIRPLPDGSLSTVRKITIPREFRRTILPGWGSRNLRSARDLIRPLAQFCRMLKHSLNIHPQIWLHIKPKIYVYLLYIDMYKCPNNYHRDIGHLEIWKMKRFSTQIVVWRCLSFWRTSNFRPWHLSDDLRKTSDDTFHAPKCGWCIKVRIH